jgi:FtsZ-interacting cell division protein ZipA
MNSNVLIVVGVLVLMLALSGGLTNLNVSSPTPTQNAIVSEEEVNVAELPEEQQVPPEQQVQEEHEEQYVPSEQQETVPSEEVSIPQGVDTLSGADIVESTLKTEELPVHAEQAEQPVHTEQEEQLVQAVQEEQTSSLGKWSVSGWSGDSDFASF